MSLRQYLSSVVLTCFKNDDVLQSLFLFEGITSKDWCESIVIDGRWTSTFDVIVFSYVMKINVITVGNYMNGFSVQSSKTYFNTIKSSSNTSFESDIFYSLWSRASGEIEGLGHLHCRYLLFVAVPFKIRII